MEDQSIVVTVRLSDMDETQQPDPICLPAGDLGTTWRHFETLLLSMYHQPPSAIHVCYLDDDSDWISISSDTEFHEAIKIAKRTDEILQLRVRRKDTQPPVYYTSTLPDTTTHPTQPDHLLQPLHTTYHNQQQHTPNTMTYNQNSTPNSLVYPTYTNTHPVSYNTCPIPYPSVAPTHQSPYYVPYTITYPPHLPTSQNPSVIHYPPIMTSQPQPQGHSYERNENVNMMDANGKHASIQNRPDLTTEQKVEHLKSMFKRGSDKDEGLNSLSNPNSDTAMWQEASTYSPSEKLQFMKCMMVDNSNSNGDKHNQKPTPIALSKTVGKNENSEARQQPDLLDKSLPGSNSKNPRSAGGYSLAQQDPFEVVSDAVPRKPSEDLQQLQLDEILTPQKNVETKEDFPATNAATKATEKKTTKVEVVRNSSSTSEGTKVEIPVVIEQPHNNDMSSPTSIIVCTGSLVGNRSQFNFSHDGSGKGLVHIPDSTRCIAPDAPTSVSAARFPMMEGAQSGANAVAIDIPEGEHHGAAHKCEDVTASGGAACLSASAETGETIGYTQCLEGAAVSDKGTFTNNAEIASLKKVKKSDKKSPKNKHKDDKDGKKKKCKDKERERTRSVTKEKREGLKMEADVESGEKVLKMKGYDSSVKKQELINLMNKMQSELHSSIVRDVSEETNKLLNEKLSRSVSHSTPRSSYSDDDSGNVKHWGFYCDSCNAVIHGIRYKCGNCVDFDLCESCETLARIDHDPSHVFLKLRRPLVLREELPLLRKVIYAVQDRDDADYADYAAQTDNEKQVSISSMSEVSTPLQLGSPPNTPTESYKKEEPVNQWVWDSTFDINHRNLYPLDGEKVIANCDTGEVTNEIVEETIIKKDAGDVQEGCQCVVTEDVSVVESKNQERRNGDDEMVQEKEQKDNNKDESKTSSTSFEKIDDSDDEYDDVNEDEEDDSHTSVEYVEEEVEDFEEVFAYSSDERRQSIDSDSDTSSDDFCVLDPPSRLSCCDEEETTTMKYFDSQPSSLQLQHSLDVPSSEIVEHVRAEGEALVIAATKLVPATAVVVDENTITETAIEIEEEVVQKLEAEINQMCVATSDNIEDDENNDDNEDEKVEAKKVVEEDGIVKEVKDCDDSETDIKVSDCDTVEVEEQAEGGCKDDDVLMNMSPEERVRFLNMVKDLKDRAEDLEKELKVRKESEEKERQAKELEQQYRCILEEKEREAARQNDQLSQMMNKTDTQAKKLKVRRTRATTSSSTPSPNPTLMQLALSAAQTTSSSSTSTSSTTNKQPKKKSAGMSTTSSTKHAGKAVRFVDSKDGGKVKVSRATFTSQTGEGLTNVVVITKDADCQTAGIMSDNSKSHASHVIQSVATGVTKAAGVAYYTAKDVFYSLQAKQLDKKATPGQVVTKAEVSSQATDTTYTPPSSVWTPPADTFTPPTCKWTPPKSEWTPPKSDWKPKESTWTPKTSEWAGPNSEWTPPAGFYQEPALVAGVGTSTSTAVVSDGNENAVAKSSDNAENKLKTKVKETENKVNTNNSASEGDSNTPPPVQRVVATASSSITTPLPPLPAIEITDPVLRREVQGMQLLMEMGFANRDQNRRLLQEFDGDVEKVVQSLLQEERQDHWAWNRH